MFYSHEILTSQKHGVATVWVLATLDRSCASRKVSRKAIQEVNVPKACVTIDEPPGAPIALRLQASLLYGVSRVYQQQCHYVLGDAEKFRISMRGLMRVLDSGTLDPNAGRAKKKQLMIQDDPEFHISNFFDLPPLDLDELGNLRPTAFESQFTGKYSQLSPFSSQQRSSSGRNSLAMDFGAASFFGSQFGPDPFGGDSSAQKPHPGADMFAQDELPLRLEDFDAGFTIDADGNIHEHPEPEQPQAAVPIAAHHMLDHPGPQHHSDDFIPLMLGDEAILNPGDAPLPDADALPVRQHEQDPDYAQPEDDAVVTAASRRKGRRRKALAPDTATEVSRTEFRDWTENYVQRMEEENKRHRARRDHVTKDQAAQNAYNIMFGRGIGGVGQDMGLPGFQHELAEHFAGHGLQMAVFGRIVGDDPHGRRRSASQAFGDEEDSGSEEGRRVRPRSDDGYEARQRLSQERQLEDDGNGLNFGDFDPLPEVGREIGHPLSDQHPPWHRHSILHGSSMKGSSAKPAAGQGPRQVQESPLQHRGRAVQEFVRFSDNDGLGFDGSAGMGSVDDHPPDQPDFHFQEDPANHNSSSISTEGRDFLSYVQAHARETGTPRSKGDELWVDFAGIFPPSSTARFNAASAFYQLLCLSTNRTIKVDQEGRDRNNIFPFGKIEVGVCIDALQSEQGEESDYDLPSIGDRAYHNDGNDDNEMGTEADALQTH
ncbi:hypothetical protein MGG_02688 [Pyricularia oryzae 70-15]|uniref:Rad21/Rec8-like protein N-terminal domain-containing protein n=1 Tax=Pyricularia oryzae (strain 70-15 / ATCC MYA-4617 / FGSC 8958) TaxID=242507 RepID=G5EHS1_PYRO7|nr:uncharacterized protein MGG_02688 [Pyricularia oryzae 70-15]EAQ71016.1 hypothetical protein MGCH7_ch7g423 [Pyricularia oryzae 70-15]EHA46339.1 hypothetical protein MGG_02688 [Pyricularia oryzae 70-15]KAI7923149.1 hypothetical protein M9X92_004523 [Pyricularia oryzae]